MVVSLNWNSGTVSKVGAATLCSGTTGCTGAVSAANSLVGTRAGDQVGFNGAVALTNGNYHVDAGKIAVDEWKAIFIAAWAVLYPLLVQLPAVVKILQSTPGVGLLVKYLAGNWGFAANANRDPR